TAKDPFGNTATGYTGTVALSSSDPQASLPASYTFQPGDQGTKTFLATLRSAGLRSLTATDVVTPSRTGTQANIQVNAAGTTTGLTVAPQPAVFGQTVTLHALVGATAPGSGTPGGSVTFRDNGTALATVALANGQASQSLAALAVGSHTL